MEKGSMLSVILCLVLYTQGVYSECDKSQNITYLQMCQSGTIIGGQGETIYLDATGAPRAQPIECDCSFSLGFTGPVQIDYKVISGLPECGVSFHIKDFQLGCDTKEDISLVFNTPYNITYRKTEAQYRDWYACLRFKPNFGALTVQCFQSRRYVPTTTSVTSSTSETKTTTTTSSSTTTTTTTTTPTSTSTTTTTPTTTTTTPTTTTTTTTTTSPTTTTTKGTTTTTPTTTTPTTTTTATTTYTSTTPTTTTTTPTTTTPTTTTASTTTSTKPLTTTPKSTTTSQSKGPKSAAALTEEDDGSNWPIIGIVIGLCFLVLFVFIVLFVVCRKRKEKKKLERTTSRIPMAEAFEGDDVVVTDNQIFNYDGQNPAHAMNALFVGGIPDTPGAPEDHLPTFQSDPGAEYAVINDSTRGRGPSRERPKLSTFNDSIKDRQPIPLPTQRSNNDNIDNTDAKVVNDYSEPDNEANSVSGAAGCVNPGYDPDYLVPYDNRSIDSFETVATNSTYPYAYINHDQLNARGDGTEANRDDRYTSMPRESTTTDDGHYKRLISKTSSEVSPGEYVNSPTRSDVFFNDPDENESVHN